MKVFVTGSTGFVGSHLVDALLEKGYQVYVLVRKTSNLQWLEGKDVVKVVGDLRGELSDDLKNTLKESDYVYHIAGAIMGVKKEDYFRVNEDGTRNLLKAMIEAGASPQRFLYLSSLAAIGPGSDKLPVKEEDPPHPVSWYGESKLAGEKVVREYENKFPVTIVRPPPVYGPRDYGMLDVFRMLKYGIVSDVGKDTYTNFVFVKDLVKGIILAAEFEKGVGETFHIGDNENIATIQAFKRVAQVIGKRVISFKIPLPVVYIAAIFSEIKIRVTGEPEIFNFQKVAELKQTNWMMDISKAKKVLGYEPEYPLERGGEITYKWYLEKGWI